MEFLSGMMFLGLWGRWGHADLWFVACYSACAALLVVAFIDWDTFIIPDVLSLGLLAFGVAAAPINPYFSGTAGWRVLNSMAGAVSGFLICWGIAALGEFLFKKEAMGGGDIKLLAAIGAWTGVLGAVDCLMIASLLGSIYGVVLMLRKKIRRQDPIPFGPFLSAGAVFDFFYLMPWGFPFGLM